MIPHSEPSQRDSSDEWSQHMVLMRNKKNYQQILPFIESSRALVPGYNWVNLDLTGTFSFSGVHFVYLSNIQMLLYVCLTICYASLLVPVFLSVNEVKQRICINPIELRMAKTLWSFGHSECNRVNRVSVLLHSEWPNL